MVESDVVPHFVRHRRCQAERVVLVVLVDARRVAFAKSVRPTLTDCRILKRVNRLNLSVKYTVYKPIMRLHTRNSTFLRAT